MGINIPFKKKRGYKYARTGGSKLYNSATDPVLAIPSHTVISSDKYYEKTITALKNLSSGETLVLTFHGIPDLIDPDYSTTVENLKEILQLIKEKK